MKIQVRNNNINTALRLLKKKTKESLADVKEREHYEKPSAVKNRNKQAAKLREKRRQGKDNERNNKQF